MALPVSSTTSAVIVNAAGTFPAVIIGSVYIQDFPFGPFNLVNLTTGALTPQTSVQCGGISAAAVGPDGIALGTESDGTVVQVDPVSGRCSTVFIAPEWLDALAVAGTSPVRSSPAFQQSHWLCTPSCWSALASASTFGKGVTVII